MNLISEWIDIAPELLGGLGASLRLALFSIAVGLPLGLLLAVGTSSSHLVVRGLVIAVVEIGRGTPALVMLQIIYFGLPEADINLTAFLSAGIALGLTTGAYTSEIIRGGLQAVPQGESEAADALGMTRLDTLRFILVPQGLRVAIPALMGFAILIFQATALAYTIALPELLGAAYSIGNATFEYLSVLVLAGLFYAAITVPASFLTEAAEKRLGRHA